MNALNTATTEDLTNQQQEDNSRAVGERNAEILRLQSELQVMTAALETKGSELDAKSSELEAKESELVAKTGQVAALNISLSIAKKEAATALAASAPEPKTLTVVRNEEVNVEPTAAAAVVAAADAVTAAATVEVDWGEEEGWGEEAGTAEPVPDQINQLELEIANLRQQVKVMSHILVIL